MTTPSEITATEKLLDLIRASSSTERKDVAHAINASDSFSEHTFHVTPPEKAGNRTDHARISNALTAEKETEFILTLEDRDPEDESITPLPPPLEPPTHSDNFTSQDTEKLLDLIRSSSLTEKKDTDQIDTITESVTEHYSQLPPSPDTDNQRDLSSSINTQIPEINNDFFLSLESSDTDDDIILFTDEPSPPLEPEQPSPSDQGADILRVEKPSPLSPPREAPKPSNTSAPHDDDDDDDDIQFSPRVDVIPPDTGAENNTATSLNTPASTSKLHNFLNFKRLRPLLTKTTIGIDIRPGVIHIVKSQTNKKGPELLAYESIRYDFDPVAEPKNLFEDQEFISVLFRAVANFHTSQDHHEIWCSYPFLNSVELHNTTIPKVADKDLATAVFWSAKRELEFDETARIFDFFPLQEITEANQTKTQMLITLAPRAEVDSIKAMFKNAGFPLTGISFPAAAIQNLLRNDPSFPKDQPVVYFSIRKTDSFIDLFYQGKIFFSREIKTGVDSFVESLLDQAQSQRVVIDEENAKEYLFRSGNSGATPHKDNDTLATLFDWEKLSVIGRLARQLVRTFEYCSTTFKIPPVGAIATSGEFIVSDTILKSIENRVGIKCMLIEPLSSTIFHRDAALPSPNNYNLLVAAGLSLSDKQSTANFLFTYGDRAKEASSNRVNSIISITSICLALCLGVTFVWQYNNELTKKKEIALLQQKLELTFQSEPRSRSNDYLSQTVQRITQFHHDSKESGS